VKERKKRKGEEEGNRQQQNMNYRGIAFGTARELGGLISLTTLKHFVDNPTYHLRVNIYPEGSAFPEGMPRSFFADKVRVYGLWYNLSDLARCVKERDRLHVIVRNRLKVFCAANPTTTVVATHKLEYALGEYCLARRRRFLSAAENKLDGLRDAFSATIDDYAMQSFGYRPGTGVRTLEKFLKKKGDKYSPEDYCIVRTPHPESLDFAAKIRFKTEMWVKPEMMQRLNAEPSVASPIVTSAAAPSKSVPPDGDGSSSSD